MVLRGDDDYHGEDGAQDDGGDADGQADEGEVACLAGGYFRRHHVPSGYRRAHLNDVGERGHQDISYVQDWEGYFGNVIGYRLLVTLFKM